MQSRLLRFRSRFVYSNRVAFVRITDSALSFVKWTSSSTSCVIALDPFTRDAWIAWNLTSKDRNSGRIPVYTHSGKPITMFCFIVFCDELIILFMRGCISEQIIFTVSAKSLSTALSQPGLYWWISRFEQNHYQFQQVDHIPMHWLMVYHRSLFTCMRIWGWVW